MQTCTYLYHNIKFTEILVKYKEFKESLLYFTRQYCLIAGKTKTKANIQSSINKSLFKRKKKNLFAIITML